MTNTVRVRYFAGAAQAAGTDQHEVNLEEGDTLGAMCEKLGRGNERLASVLAVSSFLVDGKIVTDRDTDVSGVSSVDVLPPFAGG